jgi:Helicase conserved C-terminal domain.
LVIEVKRGRSGEVAGKITVTNYQQLEKFNPHDFEAVVCDESSILKNFNGETKDLITKFMRKVKYRLLCTATPSPNDFIELGTSSESLGELGYIDMLNKFFKNQQNNSAIGRNFGNVAKWILKEYAKENFWRWICSWSRSIRKPSDLGFNDKNFILPKLFEKEIYIENCKKREQFLFEMPAINLQEQREVIRLTINDRCEKVAEIVNNSKEPFLVWCNLNDEGKLLNKLIADSQEVFGSDSDEKKEEKLYNFSKNKFRVLITKPKIGAFGLNFQHCNNMTFFLSHSFEQYYQGVRRCWRFGQKKSVSVYIITTQGETQIFKNLQRKQKQANEMFDNIIKNMQNILKIKTENNFNKK